MHFSKSLQGSKCAITMRPVSIESTLLLFLLIHNFLVYLNKKLYDFGITDTALCSFCKTLEETPIHIFYDCIHVKSLWEKLHTKFQNDTILPSLTPQTVILRLTNEATTLITF